jgi:hypothetical protein
MLPSIFMASVAAAASVLAHPGPPPPGRSEATTAYATRVVDANLMGVTVSNYGFVGNNFVTRAASMEYPLGDGFEHLVLGGLWIGAQAVDAGGAFTGVATACLDMAQGASTAPATEYTPSSVGIAARSSRPASPYYDPAAISDLDLVSTFDDLTPKRATANAENHRPMGLLVRQENYAWNLDRLAHVLFFRFVIKTTGPTLTGLQVGLYTELASGPKNLYSSWPPTTVSGPGSWFGKAWLLYDAQRLLREHYCTALPVPDGCNLGFVPYWAGVELLTSPDATAGQAVTLAAWQWSPLNVARDQDLERYALMGAGTIADLTLPELMPQTGDPVEVLSLGPFASLAAGDSIVVGFALVGGADVADIQENAAVAQRAWDSGFTDLPTPVQLSLVGVDARPGRVAIAWQSPEPGIACTVERLAPGEDWAEIARLTANGTGRIALEDRTVLAGTRYGYRALVVEDGAPVVLDEVWVDVPGEARFALHGWSPNPSSGVRARVSFSLAHEGHAMLELLDVGGRRLHVQDLDGLGPGRHMIELDAMHPLGSGVYFLRLTQDGRTATRRVAVVQ